MPHEMTVPQPVAAAKKATPAVYARPPAAIQRSPGSGTSRMKGRAATSASHPIAR